MMRGEISRTRFLPYPELVELPRASELFRPAPEPYAIVDSLERAPDQMSGAVNKVARVMWVPLEPEGRAVCRHELGHVRWSRLAPYPMDFDPRVLAAVEDARVNLALRARRVPVDLGELGDLRVSWLLANDAKHGDGFALFVRGVASVGTSVEARLGGLLSRLARPDAELAFELMRLSRTTLERARVRHRGEAAPERVARELAEEIARRLRARGLLDENGVSTSTVVLNCSEAAVDAPVAAFPVGEAPPAKRPDLPDVEPGRMRFARARLTRALPNTRGLRVWRSATEGSVVRHMHRFAIDRAIFRKRAGQSRGTVLIDTSSSMRLTDADLERLVANAARGTCVAMYSGQGREGELRIIAQGGKRAEGEALTRFGGGNVVDLPARRWLARQPRPRLWVSDGKTTGIDDRTSPRLRAQCRGVCVRSGIRRIADVEAAAKLLGARS